MNRCNTELDEKDSSRYVMKCHVMYKKLKESHKKFYGVTCTNFSELSSRKITENQQKGLNIKTIIG